MFLCNYFKRLKLQRLVVRTEDRLARKKAQRDSEYELGDFMSKFIDTNPYRDESAAMAAAYDEERKLLIEEFNRNNGSKH